MTLEDKVAWLQERKVEVDAAFAKLHDLSYALIRGGLNGTLDEVRPNGFPPELADPQRMLNAFGELAGFREWIRLALEHQLGAVRNIQRDHLAAVVREEGRS